MKRPSKFLGAAVKAAVLAESEGLPPITDFVMQPRPALDIPRWNIQDTRTGACLGIFQDATAISAAQRYGLSAGHLSGNQRPLPVGGNSFQLSPQRTVTLSRYD